MTINTKAIRAAAEAAIKKYGGYPVTDPAFVIALLDRLEAAEKDAERLDWLLAYLVSDDTSKDDEIVAASEVGVDMIKTAIDTAMKEQK